MEANRKKDGRPRIMVFGAHPDDPDLSAGGFALRHVKLGHKVRFVSLTNGDAGHHRIGGVELAERRKRETENVEKLTGIEYQVCDISDGKLTPSLENRETVIRAIRKFEPDLVLAPRPNDYHPDHRYASRLVQDSMYMVTVPNICPLTPHLRYNPVAAYVEDNFQRPYPFSPDFVLPIDDVIEEKLDIVHCHKSQVYEWLPYNGNYEGQVPEKEGKRRDWLADVRKPRMKETAEKFRERLVEAYGKQRGEEVEYAEAFELCEYGGELSEDMEEDLFHI